MAHLGLTPPPPFLQTPGDPVMSFEAWERMFETYLLALSENELPDKRKRALLIHCIGVEAQRIFYTLDSTGTTYAAAKKALTTFFSPKVNIVAERNKFRQRSQNVGESVVHYVAALRELAAKCDFKAMEDDMIRDQLVEKTNSARIRERLLLEDELKLKKAITIACQVESVVADAKAINNKKVDAEVGAVQGTTFRSGRRRNPPQQQRNAARFSAARAESSHAATGKKCYRCGSSSHLANSSTCPAKSVVCKQCHKSGHFAKVCRSTPTSHVNEVSNDNSNVVVLNIADGADMHRNKLWCNVSLQAAGGSSTNANLLIDTGSAVSIIPNGFYTDNFKDIALTKPTLRLMTYTKEPIPVLGCVTLDVLCHDKSAKCNFYVVPVGVPILGMDLLTALQLDITKHSIQSPTPPSAQVQHTHTTSTDNKGVTNFIHKVKLRPEIPPVQQKLRRLPFSIRDDVTAELVRMEKEGIIERIDSSPWVSPILAIKKKSGQLRLCTDLREVNKAVVIDSHPLPHIEEVFHELRGAQMFSTIDLQSAYHQLPLHADSRDLTAFITHEGLFRYLKVPYGLASAPSAFQRMMSHVLAGVKGVQCYLDDIIISGETPEVHEQRLKTVLQRLHDTGLKLNMSKCRFRKTELPFLGHIISAAGLRPDLDHIKAVADAPTPHDAPALRSFLGLTSFYSKFIPNYSVVVEPLRALLRKDCKYAWTTDAQHAFTQVKTLIVTSPALALYDPALPTIVTTDACDYGIGAVLTQLHGDTEKTVAFASRTLTDSERKYSTIEKEALACVWATERWRTYLWGNHFTLCTDHSPLTTLLTTKGLGRAGMRIARWSARLLNFNYTIKYKRGCDNVIADCLSRLPLPHADMDVEPDTEVVALVSDDFAAITAAELTAACKDCPVLQQVRHYMQHGWPRTHKGLDPAIQPYFKLQTELSAHGDCIIRGSHRVVVPSELQPKLIQIAHDTHQGIVRTKQRLRALYWWPGMDASVQAAIKSCVTCAQHDKTAVVKAAPLTPVSLPDGAWEKLAIDIVGPYLNAPPDCRYAITMVDYYSKWPEVAFASEVTSASIIKFLSIVFSREGNPLELVTDNGSVFVSAEFESFLASRDIKHLRSSVYYPQCNGEVERWNRVLKDCLQTADIEGRPWKQFVTDFLFSYRATPHSLTQVSPAELLHGRPLNTKLNIRGLPTTPKTHDHAALRDTVHAKQVKAKEYTDRRRSAQASTFKVGDFVRIKKPVLVRKGARKFTAPIQITAQKGPATFLLSDGKVWNASHLAFAPPDTVPVTLTPQQPDEAPPAAVPFRRHVRPPEWHKDYVT